MVIIRLTRGGSKRHPFYHVVVADSRFPRDGRCIERLGYYNPIDKKQTELKLNHERITYWMSKGAQPSDRVARLIKQAAKVAA